MTLKFNKKFPTLAIHYKAIPDPTQGIDPLLLSNIDIKYSTSSQDKHIVKNGPAKGYVYQFNKGD